MINEKLSLADHTDFVSKKVNQRLGVLRRIKHLLPNYARNVFVSFMVLPFYDYCDIIWGDRNSRALMDSPQVLHNKIVLNRPVHSSSTQALIDLSIGGSIFGFDGAFIGLSIFLNALKHWPCKLHFFNNLPQSQNKKKLHTVKSEIYF